MRCPSDVTKTCGALTLRRTLTAFASIAALSAVSTLTGSANGSDTRTGSPNAVERMAGQAVLAVLGITDAMAGNGNGNGGGNDNGGYQAGCSDQNGSNSSNAARCNGGGGSGSSGGTSDSGSSDGSSDNTSGSGSAGPVTSFRMCDGLHYGETGHLLELYVNGRTALSNVRCD